MNKTMVLGMRVDETSIKKVVDIIAEWCGKKNQSRYVCVSNVHMCIETYDSDVFRSVVNNADIVVPDGKPLVIGSRLLGGEESQQVRGADLTRALLELSNEQSLSIGFYGGSEQALNGIRDVIALRYPNAELNCLISPPYREISEKEDNEYIESINESGVNILFVGLGCPKQEIWMANHKGKVDSVMIGVGAVFDFLSGTKREAPKWIQEIGLEWLFRLLSEPKRLWKRYLIYNPRFVWIFTKQLVNSRLGKA
jgi:N-acetylglucosaminyldiphosphoundecaprenol N-acetyl-beta-D-mannosaminyltransferase